ncbi:hypothetical protein UA08_00463 [Talaromyces atroroseus]|uniref:CCHC-type domain-containing protein n=1 Tax=Talaromyces atroroseus TaxID=1441469 RepID=A0A225B443_TALAT|nr:hypothetical protein UA08_00463 [Talaromyces atroroseus]OKL64508.1 hypothetical protein UA08_00463 [Talaromyces atroroseus]
MPGTSDDEDDSRTASVGLARVRVTTSDPPNSKDSSRKKGSRKKGRSKKNVFHDFVPKGGKFSATPLAVDPENSTSSSRSNSLESDEGSEQKMNKRQRTNAPAINWNQASRSTIRTSLGTRPTLTGVKKQAKSAFDAVNDKYFRSRSASVSDEEAHEDNHTDAAKAGQNTNGDSKTYYVDDSDGSDTGEDSEGDDSMMLNIGQQGGGNGPVLARDDSVNDSTPPFVLDTSPNLGLASANTSINQVEQQQKEKLDIRENGSVLSDHSLTQLPPQSKAEAFAEFAALYKTWPVILADLEIKDLEIQNRFFYYNSSIHDLDLTKPISCTECLKEGHLAFICPSKECKNCGSWNLHETLLCPSVRRCQRCREVGHDSHTCPSSLKASAAETPCDYCGSDTHTEHDCDKLWKFPKVEPLEGPIKVSISCSYCTNKNHLFGDCPLKRLPTTSSTFTLKDYVPSMITNLNSVLGPRKADDPGMSIRGRAAGHPQEIDSPDDEDTLVLHGSRTQSGFRGGRGTTGVEMATFIDQDNDLVHLGLVTNPLLGQAEVAEGAVGAEDVISTVRVGRE